MGDPGFLYTCGGTIVVPNRDGRTSGNTAAIPMCYSIVLGPPENSPGGTYVKDIDKSWQCEPCPRGTWKPAWRNATELCTRCGPKLIGGNWQNMTTRQPETATSGATRAEQCTCLVQDSRGKHFDGCACPTGYYLAGTWPDGLCTPCNIRASGVNRTTDSVDLTRGVRSFMQCNKCKDDFYGPHDANANCTECPAHSETEDIGARKVTECLCERGMYQKNGLCVKCPANSNTKAVGSLKFEDCLCLKDHYMENKQCVQCPANRFTKPRRVDSDINSCICGWGKTDADKWAINAGVCKLCPEGARAEDSCNCPANWYQNGTDSDQCLPCPKYTTSVMGATDLKGCKCYQSMKQLANGLCGCEPGKTYVPNRISGLAGSCQSCGIDGYKLVDAYPESSENPCLKCTDFVKGSVSLVVGSPRETLCTCPNGTSVVLCQNDAELSDGWCQAANATAGVTREKWCRGCTTYTISSMAANYPAICPPSMAHVKKGFWRQDKDTRKILRCPWGSACIGGPDPSNQCIQGHTGALCQVCKKDWTLLSGTCYPCENVDTTMRKWVALIVLASILVGLAYYAKLQSDANKVAARAGAGGASGADEAVGVVSQQSGSSSGTVQSRVLQWAKILDPWFQLGKRKFKIVISFYQVVTAIPRFYPVDFPITLQDFVAYFNIVNLEFMEIVPVDCFGTVPYQFRYLLKAIAPLVMSAFFYILGTKIADEQKKQILFKLYLFFLFTIYPAMCSMGGESLRCLETSDADAVDTHRWLKSDYSIDCDSLGSFLIVDVFCMILYPIGIPALFYYLMKEHEDLLLDGSLRPDRNHLDDGIVQDKRGMAPIDLTHLEALCVQYKPEYWWFEVF